MARTQRVGRYVERTYRKLLGRLREVQRQQRQGHSSALLLRKITKAWPSDIPWQGVDMAVQQIEAVLTKLVQDDKNRALHEWR